MNFKPLPFMPQVRTRVLRIQAIPDQWCSEAVASSNYGFLRVWLEREEQTQTTINWGAISGLAISLAVSAGFWAGVALVIEKIWK